MTYTNISNDDRDLISIVTVSLISAADVGCYRHEYLSRLNKK